ncbi:hypothetical protein KUTeg_023604 [Tegillarca granosa]|uniref:Uncharacterized protein n=1 Tax=Tegillarca granosa TaxID=220873 RepID=A0ABQ9E2I8_TEGGR|nr:hypothetical protein KUTeg_023604 [Tegillarca granosa]
MEWEDVGTDALAKVGRAQQQLDQSQGQAPSPHPTRQGQSHYPPQNINQNPNSAFNPYHGRYPENSDRHLPQNDPIRVPQRNPHDGQNHDSSYEQDPRYRHPSGYDPHRNPQDRADPRHNDRYYDQGHPSAQDPHNRDLRHSYSDPRQQHPSGYDPRNHDTSYREQDGYDPRNHHPSGYQDGQLGRNRDQSPQDPYYRGSNRDPQGRPGENDQFRYDPNESRRSDEMDGRYNPQRDSRDPRRSEIDARDNRSATDLRKSEDEPPYARPHKSSNDPRQHHQNENGYIPGLNRESTLKSSRPDQESQSDKRYYNPRDKSYDQRYPEPDRRAPDNRGRNHSDDDPYIQMRPSDRDLKRDDQKRSSVQKLQDWQRQELERHRYGVPSKSDIVTPRSNEQSQNSEYFGYYSPKREAMERQRSNNLNDSRNSETFQKELHSEEPEDGYSTLTKYQTRDSLRPHNQPSQSSQPRSENKSRSDSSSPKRNPDLMIDVGHTYVNFPRDPYEDSRNEIPSRPPLPTAETEIPQLGNKYPALSGQRLRMSICASDLIGKTHDELVLMLIQLRREYTSLEKELNFYREKLEQKRPQEHQYRRM